MSSKRASVLVIVLGSALAISVCANVFQVVYHAVDVGTLEADMSSHQRSIRRERDALRSLSLDLANGVDQRQAVARAGGNALVPDEPDWLVSGPLMVKFAGNRLSRLCGTTYLLPDSCTGDGVTSLPRSESQS